MSWKILLLVGEADYNFKSVCISTSHTTPVAVFSDQVKLCFLYLNKTMKQSWPSVPISQLPPRWCHKGSSLLFSNSERRQTLFKFQRSSGTHNPSSLPLVSRIALFMPFYNLALLRVVKWQHFGGVTSITFNISLSILSFTHSAYALSLCLPSLYSSITLSYIFTCPSNSTINFTHFQRENEGVPSYKRSLFRTILGGNRNISSSDFEAFSLIPISFDDGSLFPVPSSVSHFFYF